MKSFRPIRERMVRQGTADAIARLTFVGAQVNETHEWRDGPRCGAGMQGCWQGGASVLWGYVLIDNLQGLVVDLKITEVTGTSERDAARDMFQMVPSSGRITVGADRG